MCCYAVGFFSKGLPPFCAMTESEKGLFFITPKLGFCLDLDMQIQSLELRISQSTQTWKNRRFPSLSTVALMTKTVKTTNVLTPIVESDDNALQEFVFTGINFTCKLNLVFDATRPF